MKIGLYISSKCRNNQLLYNFAQILVDGLESRIQVCAPHNILNSSFDVIHVLAGSDIQTKKIISKAAHNNVPILYSPLGEFQPWTHIHPFIAWEKKLFQKQLINSIKVVHVWSKAEQKYLSEFSDKLKFVYIPNPIVTHNVSSETMCGLFNKLYKKIIDTNIDTILDPLIRKDIYTLLQISLNQEFHLVPSLMPEFTNRISSYTEEQWQRALLFASNQGISDYLAIALDKLEIHPPINVQQKNQVSRRHNPNTKLDMDNIQIDNSEEIIYRELNNIINAREHGQALLSHYVSLYKLLCTIDYNEDKLIRTLHNNHIFERTQQLMVDLQTITGLTEGFIPSTLYIK